VSKIRDDLEGVVYVTRDHGASPPLVLRAGDIVPKGVTVGEHLLSTRAAPKPTEPPTEPPAPVQAPADPAGEPGDSDPPVEPPSSGKGATKVAWAAYAVGLGIEPKPDASREDIIAAVDEALGR
jgi:hypothetical protein